MRHAETHRTERIGWLRAAVLGANDGLISTASLAIGVVAAGAGRAEVVLAATAGLVAGAMSMAAGEYVSVSSQADTERADLTRERAELAHDPEAEHAELAGIYVERGLTPALAGEVARQLMKKDALAVHSREELGLSAVTTARPLQAALASALTFAAGAAVPVVLCATAPIAMLSIRMTVATLALLAVLGGIAARLGGASVMRGAARVAFWGALAMALTALVGRLFGKVV